METTREKNQWIGVYVLRQHACVWKTKIWWKEGYVVRSCFENRERDGEHEIGEKHVHARNRVHQQPDNSDNPSRGKYHTRCEKNSRIMEKWFWVCGRRWSCAQSPDSLATRKRFSLRSSSWPSPEWKKAINRHVQNKRGLHETKRRETKRKRNRENTKREPDRNRKNEKEKKKTTPVESETWTVSLAVLCPLPAPSMMALAT